ncbi:AbrB family transcriptional regulator [Bacillus horti]|uniref:Membrane AbrB-like protein n=1 Tax=Caldalkalibacillus horti TaxID=77523 RepID=A0ABT9VTZ8_9BACI|nr:AbrB family transcriptional regulator [Bacillus horti]MDQ0164461.1 membrane AbrB-like protein [Bacillus horti]
MAVQKTLFLLAVTLVGLLFTLLKVPAGWLIGALLTGIFYRLWIGKLQFSDSVFKLALALVGVNIGFMMNMSFFSNLLHFFLPLFVAIGLLLAAGIVFGHLLHRLTGLDSVTSFFCFIPGGASEAVAISQEYGANEPIVAAFHSTRIFLYVLTIPILVGITNPLPSKTGLNLSDYSITFTEVLVIGVIIILAIYLSKLYKLPAGTLLYAMLFGFLLNQFVLDIDNPPSLIVAIGQLLLGGIIGLRFTRETFKKLKQVGKYGILLLFTFYGFSFAVAYLFTVSSPLDFLMSLLSSVPAGAAEMASTAYFLQLDASLVASLQLTRLITIFIMMPVLAHLLFRARARKQ